MSTNFIYYDYRLYMTLSIDGKVTVKIIYLKDLSV